MVFPRAASLAGSGRRRCVSGVSAPEIATELLGKPFTTIKQWLWNDAPEGYRRLGRRSSVAS